MSVSGNGNGGNGGNGPRRPSSSSSIEAADLRSSRPPPATFEDLVREVRQTRAVLDEVIAHSTDRERDVNRKFEAIMELLKESLSRQ